MKIFRTALALTVVCALAGCGLLSAVTSQPVPKSPEQVVYDAESSLDIATKQVLAYAALPRCGTAGAPVICSNQSTINTAYAALSKAFSAIKDARTLAAAYAVIKSPTASDGEKMQAALNLLQLQLQGVYAITSTLPAQQ